MALTEIKQDGLDDEAVNEAKLQISNAGSNGDFLQKQSGNTGGLTWAAAGSGTPEGTAILSTGETGTAKFLRIDGDNSCSWQVPSTTDSTKMPLAGGTFTGDVTFDNQSSAGRDIIWDESADALEFQDNTKATFGTGNDLQIYHDGSNSYLKNTEGNIAIEAKAGEMSVKCIPDAAVELYYNDSNKFQTTSGGVNVTGELVTDGASHAGDVIFQGDNANAYWDKSADDLIFNDNAKAVFGTASDGLEIYHDGSNSIIQDTGTGNLVIAGDDLHFYNAATTEYYIKCTTNGAVELYNDNSLKAQTTSTGFIVYGNLHMNGDDRTIKLGAGDDLQLFHDGSNSYIKNTHASAYTILSVNNGDAGIKIIPQGAVEAYHNDTKKFETTSYGALVSGKLRSQGSVIQTVGNVYQGNRQTTSSNSYIEAGVGYVDITPVHTSSKVLVRITGTYFSAAGSSTIGMIIRRHLASDNSTLATSPIGNGGHGNIGTPDGATIAGYQGDDGSSNIINTPFTIEWLDSPSTTSTIRYRLHIASNNSTVGIGGMGNDENYNTATTMIAMEIGD